MNLEKPASFSLSFRISFSPCIQNRDKHKSNIGMLSRQAATGYEDMLSLPIFLLWLSSTPLFAHSADSGTAESRGFLLNCGGSKEETVGGLKYTPDEGFISGGKSSDIKTPGVLPILSTVRNFPPSSARKHCYSFPVTQGGKYLVRTIYYYGGYDGGKVPPVFDQIVDGTKWSVVNTTEDFANGLTSYYEIVVMAAAKNLSVCLARNKETGRFGPFISALELHPLNDSMYNSTNFRAYALSTVARSSFGDEGDMISYPDDPFNRYWQPFKDQNPTTQSKWNITPSDFWNIPPVKAFSNAITTSKGKTLQIKWPPVSLPRTSYYIALYFQDNRSPSPYSWRVFDVSINGQNFFSGVHVSTDGVTICGKQWPLSGQTVISLIPKSDMPVGPVINAGEIYQILPLSGTTQANDVEVMANLARSFQNPPSDWSGDPCLPAANSWTGITCARRKKRFRIVSLNLENYDLSGSLSPSIGNLSYLTHLWLGANNLSGPIPDLSNLKGLRTLHLQNNSFEGPIPESLARLPQLHELFLYSNKLKGEVPATLRNRPGFILKL